MNHLKEALETPAETDGPVPSARHRADARDSKAKENGSSPSTAGRRKDSAPSGRGRVRHAAYSLALAVLMTAPLLYLDGRKDRDQFVTVNWLPGGLAADALILAVLALAFAALVFFFLQYGPALVERASKCNPLPRLHLSFDRRSIATGTLIVFCIWIPVMVLFYPCSSNHDFINQVYQYQATGQTYYTTLDTVVDAEFIDHHPIFDTLIYGWFISLGDALGSQNAGMFLFSILQNLGIAATLSLSVCYLERLGIPKPFRLAALAFAVFFPYYPCFASSAMKDMLFVLGFTPFCICYIEAFRTRGAALHRNRFIIAFVLATGLCILTKKLGIYICAASLLLMIASLKGVRVKSAGVLLASVIAFSIAFPAAVYPLIGGVAPGGRQESLCFALQQTTSLLIDEPEAVNEQDLETIERVLDTDAAKKDFKVALADGAKNHWRPEATSEDTIAYLKVWLKEGLANPKEYLMACAQCCGQMLIPSKQLVFPIDISDASHFEKWGPHFSSVGEGYDIRLERPQALLEASKSLRKALLDGVGSIPVLNLITTIAFYGAWIPFFCVAVCFINRKKSILALAPIMLSVCTLLISPGSLGRYVISLMFAIIPMAGWMLATFGHAKPKHCLDPEFTTAKGPSPKAGTPAEREA
ncbi:MAG: DUF6020 family protein [Eggerthellaceae bacterium]